MSVNEITLIGNLGRDPEVRYTPSGAAVATLSIATTRSWKDKKSDDWQEETEWHRVVLYDKQAESAGEKLRKGAEVYIKGRNKTRKWQDKSGKDNYTTEVICERWKKLGGKEQSSAPPVSGRDRAAGKPDQDDDADSIPW